ncbi:unnamed protein product [Meloidogyne enterolobii]|uniref:Uncharacterized protein n=1 Tax=Meloidogyne enterolobii TaxID=390850 RepID=A0ACB0Y8W4_MELEN
MVNCLSNVSSESCMLYFNIFRFKMISLVMGHSACPSLVPRYDIFFTSVEKPTHLLLISYFISNSSLNSNLLNHSKTFSNISPSNVFPFFKSSLNSSFCFSFNQDVCILRILSKLSLIFRFLNSSSFSPLTLLYLRFLESC